MREWSDTQKMLVNVASYGGLVLADYISRKHESGDLKRILPEIEALFGLPQDLQHHPEGCAGSHTLACLRQSDSCVPVVLFSVLFHDVGKARTYQFKTTNSSNTPSHTYYGHDKVAPDIIASIGKRLGWSDNITEVVSFCAQNHMRFHKIREMRRNKAIKLIQAPHFEALRHVCYCDSASRQEAFILDEWRAVEAYIDDLQMNR